MKYTTILFDLDGTLFSYDASEAKALQHTFNDFNLPFENDVIPIYRDLNAKLWQQFEQSTISQKVIKVLRFKQLGDALNLEFDADEFSHKYLKYLSEGTDLIDGARQIVEFLADKVDLVLITNGLTIVQRPRVKNSGLEKYFREVIISEEVGFAKPDTKIFDITFKRLDYPAKSEVLIVGDSLSSDMAGGINYGIDTCWYNPDSLPEEDSCKCTYVINCLSYIKQII